MLLDDRQSTFVSVVLWMRKQRPKIRPRPAHVYFQMKELDRTDEPSARMNVEWQLEKAEYAEFNLPTCGNIAVCQLCRQRQPLCGRVMMAWISHHVGSMPWCSFPWHKLLPGLTLAQKNCCTVYSLNLIHDRVYIYIHLHPCFQPTCFM